MRYTNKFPTKVKHRSLGILIYYCCLESLCRLHEADTLSLHTFPRQDPCEGGRIVYTDEESSYYARRGIRLRGVHVQFAPVDDLGRAFQPLQTRDAVVLTMK